MKTSTSARRAAPHTVAVCTAVATVILLPGVGTAGESTGTSTVRAVIGSDGHVTSVRQYAADGSTRNFGGKLPLSMTVTRDGSAYTYHVENTFSQTRTVQFTDTSGHERKTTVTLQLPLVAQLGVTVPKTAGAVTAPGATVSTDGNGNRHVLWSLVLFTPLGSASQDVTLTTSGKGAPVAQLQAAAVNPEATQGLSATSQLTYAAIQQDDFWAGYAGGGNDGLVKLSAGTAKMIDGLEQLFNGANQLHDGMGAAVDGANQLDAGTKQAYDGSKDLSKGLGQIHDGQVALTGGLGLIHDGQGALSVGLRKIHNGQGDLTGGLTQIHDGQGGLTDGLTKIHDGQSSLTGGLTQIHDGQGGLTDGISKIHDGQSKLTDGLGALASGANQLASGLPTAITGLQTIRGVVTQLVAGMGPTGNPLSPGLLDGLTLVAGGLNTVKTNMTALSGGLGCSMTRLTTVADGGPTTGACWQPIVDYFASLTPPVALTVVPGTDALSKAVLQAEVGALNTMKTGIDTALDNTNPAGIDALITGVARLQGAVSRPAGTLGPSDPGGIKQVLQAVGGGIDALLNPTTGLPAAAGGAAAIASGAANARIGSQQLTDGSATALAGSKQLTDGSASALAGSKQLTDGSAAALAGSRQLFDGSGAALDGSKRLFKGSGDALAGSKKLYAGSGDALAGSKKLAAGSGEALAGSKKLSTGLGKLSAGQHKVATGLPAAVDGSGQIADGLGQVLDGARQVHDGIDAVKKGATGPLEQQLNGASRNAHQQIAVLEAAATMAADAPGGEGTAYVLTQDPHAFALTAATGSGGHTGRNIGIGIGGLVLLVAGVGSGFAVGRQRRRVVA